MPTDREQTFDESEDPWPMTRRKRPSKYRLFRFLSMCRTHRRLFGETFWRTSWKDSK